MKFEKALIIGVLVILAFYGYLGYVTTDDPWFLVMFGIAEIVVLFGWHKVRND